MYLFSILSFPNLYSELQDAEHSNPARDSERTVLEKSLINAEVDRPHNNTFTTKRKSSDKTVNVINDHEGSYTNGYNPEQPVIHRIPQNPLPAVMDKPT